MPLFATGPFISVSNVNHVRKSSSNRSCGLSCYRRCVSLDGNSARYGNRQFSSGQNSESGPVKSTDPRLSLSGETSLKRRDGPTTIQKIGWVLENCHATTHCKLRNGTLPHRGPKGSAESLNGERWGVLGMESSQTFAVGISDLGQQTAHDRSRDWQEEWIGIASLSINGRSMELEAWRCSHRRSCPNGPAQGSFFSSKYIAMTVKYHIGIDLGYTTNSVLAFAPPTNRKP